MDNLLSNFDKRVELPQPIDWINGQLPDQLRLPTGTARQSPDASPSSLTQDRSSNWQRLYETESSRQIVELIAQTENSRTKEVIKVNDYTNPKTFNNPYRQLEEAHKLAKSHGIEYAKDAYLRAIDAALLIDYAAVQRHMLQVEKQLAETESRLATLRKDNPAAQPPADLQKQQQFLTAQKQALNEIRLAPATTRANCAFACIRSGNPQLIRVGETLLREACSVRPEITSDQHFQRHYREAYIEAARKSGREMLIPPLPKGNEAPAVSPSPRAIEQTNPDDTKKGVDAPPLPATPETTSDKQATEDEGPSSAQSNATDSKALASHPLNKILEEPLGVLALTVAGFVIVRKGARWVLARKSSDSKEAKDSNEIDKNPDSNSTTKEAPPERGPSEKKPTTAERTAESATTNKDKNLLPRTDTEVDGKKVAVEVQTKRRADGTNQLDSEGRPLREVTYEVNGKSYTLQGSAWLQAPTFCAGKSDVKLHVTTISAGDLARVQATLIPELFEATQPGGPLHGKLSTFKTLDVTYGVAPKSVSWFAIAPGDKEQNSKGFTLYARDEIAAKEIYDWLSARLKEKGLALEGYEDTKNVGDKTRDRSASNRVSIERDYFEKAETKIGDNSVAGAVVEEKLAAEIRRYVQLRAAEKAQGWDFPVLEGDGRLTQKALERFLKECEVDGRSCALGYESKNAANSAPRLVFVTSGDDSGPRGERFYLDESNARKKVLYHSRTGEPISLLTGRPAYYRISEQVGKVLGTNLDPAHLAYERVSQSQNSSENPRIGLKEIEIRGLKVKVGLEATVGDTTWKVVGQDAIDGHVIVQKLGKPIDLTGKTLKSLDDAKFHKVTIEGEQGEFYRRKDSDEIYKVVEVARTFGEESSPAHKFLVQVDEVVTKGPRSPIISGLYKEAQKTATASDNTSDKSTQPNSGSTESIKQASESTKTADEFARKLTELAKSGTVYQALVDCKVDEMTARDLESRLTSSDERARKKAWEEINKIGKTRDLESRLKARPGGAGAWALLAAPLAPLLFDQPNSPAAGKIGSAPWVK